MPLLPGDRITLCAMQFFPIHPVASLSNLSPRSDRAIFFSLSGSFVHALFLLPFFHGYLLHERTYLRGRRSKGKTSCRGKRRRAKGWRRRRRRYVCSDSYLLHTRYERRYCTVRIRSQLAALFGFNSAAGGDGAVGENKSGAAAKSGKERRERLSISAPLQLAASLPSRQKNQLKSQSTNLESIHPFSLSQGYSGEAFLIHNPRRVFGARRAEKWRHPFLHSLYHVLKSAEVLLTKKKWGV